MSTVAAGPYEHTGAYADSEFFDTTGTPPGFCRECEHAPCVAGGMTFCCRPPRFIVVAAMRAEILDLLDQTGETGPLRYPLQSAIYALSAAARWDTGPEWALGDLAELRTMLRGLVS